MSKLYIFGIGGTGARVLRSFTMMMAAGVELGFHDFVPIIIDPDNANSDLTRTVKLMNNYRSVREKLTFDDTNNNKFFRNELSQIIPNYTLKIKDTDDKRFQDFIALPSMKKENQAMMKMLFSEKNLNSSMEVGFKGNPNIGSVVLNQIVCSEDFIEFANSFEAGDKIFIISSIFGGTGASGFPLLLKTLRTGNSFPNNDIINKAEIGAITVLPYFKLMSNPESEIDSSTFISKTKSALAYYEHNISKNNSVNALYYLGDDITNTYENNEGGTPQQNDAHLIEFLAASAIIDFSKKEHLGNTNKELGLRDLKDTVSFDSFYETQKNMFFIPLTQFIMMANCLTYKYDYFKSSAFNANNEHFKDFYGKTFVSELREVCQDYLKWLSEMKSNKRSLDLFNLDSKDKPFDLITGKKAAKIFSLKSDYDLVSYRLASAANHCKSKGIEDKFLEMYYMGTSKLIQEKFKD